MPEDVIGRVGRFFGEIGQSHPRFLKRQAAFAVIAGWAGSHNIRPHVGATHVTRQNVVDGEVGGLLSAVLAGIVVAAEDLAAGEADVRMRGVDHLLQADDGRDGVFGAGSVYDAPAVENQKSFVRQHQAKRAMEVGDVDGFVVRIENQYSVFHIFTIIASNNRESSHIWRLRCA